ncbi:hypothetical protein PG993_013462 [Apiospora rasikravindrae]|uniref:3beta-hydroxysteroid 3-dehydrogenase n=1 Tax=Apiospora rasikravindrae TaxID=990691 RepID=A0ABR1RXP6_9PEZI
MTSHGGAHGSQKPTTIMEGEYRSQIPKTILATGCSSGVGFEVVKQLLQAPQYEKSYTVIIGCKDVAFATSQYATVVVSNRKHKLVFLHLELSNLGSVHRFAEQAIANMPKDEQVNYLPLDYLFLNAETVQKAGTSTHGSKWCDAQIVNQLAHHYMLLLIRDWMVPAKSCIIFVSSGAFKLGNPEQAERWHRQLAGSCIVVAVSSALVPKGLQMEVDVVKTVEEDMPADPNRIFLTSSGEWLAASEVQNTLDRELQNKWSPGTVEIRHKWNREVGYEGDDTASPKRLGTSDSGTSGVLD